MVEAAEVTHEVEGEVMEGTVTAVEMAMVAVTVATAVVMEAMAVVTEAMAIVMEAMVVVTEATVAVMEAMVAVAETVGTSHGVMVVAVAMGEEGEIVIAVEGVVAVMAEGMVKATAVAEGAAAETALVVMETKEEDIGTVVGALPLEVVEDTLLAEGVAVMVGKVEEVIRAGRKPQPPSSHMLYPTKLNLTFLVHKITINFHRIKIKITNTFSFPKCDTVT